MPAITLPTPGGDSGTWGSELNTYLRSLAFHVGDYGAVGDGTTDDTAAFQAAVTAACAVNGNLYIPEPASSYVLSDTITIQPASGGQLHMNILADGPTAQIKWAGGSTKSVFKSWGWKYSHINNVKVRLYGSVSDVVVWDIDHDSTRSSTGVLDFTMCHVTSDEVGVKDGCVGWRVGHSAGVEFSVLNWRTCSVQFGPSDTDCLGWSLEHNNGLNMSWLNSTSVNCAEAWTTKPTAGYALTAGSGAMYWYGCGGTSNDIDFYLQGQNYFISGGRWEDGEKFLHYPNSSSTPNITVQGVQLHGYTPSDGQIFRMDSPGVLTLENVEVALSGGSAYTNNMVRMSVAGSNPPILIVRGGAYYADDPFYNTDGATPIIEIRGVAKVTEPGARTATFRERTRLDTVTALTYSATIATDAALSRLFTIVATNTSAYTISNPTNPVTGRTITYDIKNSSGGAMGAITWDTAFLLAGAFTNPANTKRRTISFYYDGTNWVETNRAAADI